MTFWKVLSAVFIALYLLFMYGVGFEIGYSAVMDGHWLVPFN
jgi:hypothetical protein